MIGAFLRADGNADGNEAGGDCQAQGGDVGNVIYKSTGYGEKGDDG